MTQESIAISRHTQVWPAAVMDLHVHTSLGSGCSVLEPAELVERALELGLTAVAVTDHDSGDGYEAARRLAEGTPLVVFDGQEVWTDAGDVLIFGCRSDLRPRMDFHRLAERVEEEGGVIVLAHPFRGAAPSGSEGERSTIYGAVHAVEVLNGIDSRGAHRLAEACRARYQTRATGGSDAHRVDSVGKCVTIADRPVRDELDLLWLIRHGRPRAAHLSDLAPLD